MTLMLYIILGLFVVIAMVVYSRRSQTRLTLSPYPAGKKFAFTIIDDTDGQTLEMIRPIYDFLATAGLKTTKTVWVKPPAESVQDRRHCGDTTARKDYLAYMQKLQQDGFEIALHNISSLSNQREEIIAGFETFNQQFGHYPSIHVSHEKNKENIYFDFFLHDHHLSPPFQTKAFLFFYRALTFARKLFHERSQERPSRTQQYGGEIEDSDYFWGDICRDKILYHRSYFFHTDLNTLFCNPEMPYALEQTPYVNYWFDSSNGQDCEVFNHILSDKSLRRLKREGGACILYTHFGKGFVTGSNGKCEFNQETREKLRRLAVDPDGWFAPVSVILERLKKMQGVHLQHLGKAVALFNSGTATVTGIVLLGKPNARYYSLDGRAIDTDAQGQIIIPSLQPDEHRVFLFKKPRIKSFLYWKDRNLPLWLVDLKTIRCKLYAKMFL